MTHPLITAALAMPHTHKCVTRYADGTVREFPTRNEKSADMHAVLERRKIGRNLIDRATGNIVRVIAVHVELI